MRLREVAEAEKQQMMKARQQKLLEGQQVRTTRSTIARFYGVIPHVLKSPPAHTSLHVRATTASPSWTTLHSTAQSMRLG